MSKDKLESLLTEALSAQAERGPTELEIERTRLLLARGRADEKPIEGALTLLGCVIALAELAALVVVGSVYPPSDPLWTGGLIFAALQAMGLFTGSIGSRVALRRLRSAPQA